MIISQTPFRLSFFGGGTDFRNFYQEYGGAVLSTTIDKYCYVNVRHLPHFFDYATELSYSKIERVKSIDEIEHPAIRVAMKEMHVENIRLTYEADLPARSGLGTSSSFAVGMLHAFHAMQGRYITKKELADQAIRLERDLCNEPGGIQDQIAVAYGGFNRIDFSSDGYTVKPVIMTDERKRMLNDRMLLFFSGFSRFSGDIQAEVMSKVSSNAGVLLEMKHLVDEAEKVLSVGADMSVFGDLLDVSWRLKRGISERISNNTIDAVYEIAKKNGARGGKVLGAGGGGFMLFYAEPEYHNGIKEALKEYLHVPFCFEHSGTRVLYADSQGV